MKIGFLGALAGFLLALAAPAAATTVPGSAVVNPLGSIGPGDPPIVYSSTGQTGISGGDYGDGTTYYDYIFNFTLNTTSTVTFGATGTAGGSGFADFHFALFTTSPASTALDKIQGNTNPGNPGNQVFDGIDLTDFTGIVTSSSSGLPGTNPSLGTTLASLSAGTYFIRLFGTIPFDGTFQEVGGTIALNTVPVPAALPLFVTALAGLGLVARRRRHAACQR